MKTLQETLDQMYRETFAESAERLQREYAQMNAQLDAIDAELDRMLIPKRGDERMAFLPDEYDFEADVELTLPCRCERIPGEPETRWSQGSEPRERIVCKVAGRWMTLDELRPYISDVDAERIEQQAREVGEEREYEARQVQMFGGRYEHV